MKNGFGRVIMFGEFRPATDAVVVVPTGPVGPIRLALEPHAAQIRLRPEVFEAAVAHVLSFDAAQTIAARVRA